MESSDHSSSFWQKCRTCGKPIGYSSRYWTCSVSSCNRKSNPLVFCSVDCWDIHAPVMNHKNAGAEENFSPSRQQLQSQQQETTTSAAPVRRIIVSPSTSNSSSGRGELEGAGEKDILIVASKLKDYIRKRSGGMNTSASVMDKLSDIVRQLCDEAIHKARRDGRKTVMDRDF